MAKLVDNKFFIQKRIIGFSARNNVKERKFVHSKFTTEYNYQVWPQSNNLRSCLSLGDYEMSMKLFPLITWHPMQRNEFTTNLK